MLFVLLKAHADGELRFPEEGFRLGGRQGSVSGGKRTALTGGDTAWPPWIPRGCLLTLTLATWGFSVPFLGPVSFVCITDSQARKFPQAPPLPFPLRK